MSLDIQIYVDLDDIMMTLGTMDRKAVNRAAKRAINRALSSVRQTAFDSIRARLNIKEKSLRDRYVRMRKASVDMFGAVSGELEFSAESIPMIEFVKGSKEPIEQKGIKVKKRRKLKVEIAKGKRFVLKKAFIQRVHSKQVFKRPTKGFKKQGISSVGWIVENRGIIERLKTLANDRMQIELNRELKAELSKLTKGGT